MPDTVTEEFPTTPSPYTQAKTLPTSCTPPGAGHNPLSMKLTKLLKIKGQDPKRDCPSAQMRLQFPGKQAGIGACDKDADIMGHSNDMNIFRILYLIGFEYILCILKITLYTNFTQVFIW